MLLIFWIVGSGIPSLVITERIWASLAGWTRLVVIRVPDVKSIPRWSPRPPMASAPTSRIMPDIEKKYLDAPMKSMRHACFWPPAPSADGREITRDPPIVIRIAWVAMTAVNSETIVPMPSVNAKPLTSAVARTNRMNAVMIVTTLASMIAVRPLR